MNSQGKLLQQDLFSCKMLILIFLGSLLSTGHAVRKFPMLMPSVQPTKNETYLCTAFHMPSYEHEYIVAFEPNATKHTAHHILIYGCETPGFRERDTPRVVWDCGEMAGSGSDYSRGPTCASGSQVIYAWALDAPALTLPKSVGFKVGGDSGINYLVLQVHYANVNKFLAGARDMSGIVLSVVPGKSNEVKRRAGVYLLGTGGSIPSHQETHMETACRINQDITLYPFAFRTHTHKLGKVVSGYRLRNGEWRRIGKHSPQKPQMFYPAEKGLKIQRGDVLAARCTMVNFRDRTTFIGNTANDEMCNFYMMYYVDGDEILDEKYCFSFGPPIYKWKNDGMIGEVPPEVDQDASQLDQ